ncbi:MAG: hypothetical protein EBS07_03940 [Sphingobacteriia bacterium]|nr:hypothetical protein [Sphingobacteriia bacterium]
MSSPFALFYLRKKEIKEIVFELSSNKSFSTSDGLTYFTVSKVGLENQSIPGFYFEEEKEFIIGEDWYDILGIHPIANQPDSVELICYHDTQEGQLLKIYQTALEGFEGSGIKGKGSKEWYPIFNVEENRILTIVEGLQNWENFFLYRILSFVISPLTPPPWGIG